jgi:hypothetical protein
LLWQPSQSDLFVRQVVGDQVDALATAGDLVALGHMAVGALDVGGGVHVVLRAERVAALGAGVQDALLCLSPRCLAATLWM